MTTETALPLESTMSTPARPLAWHTAWGLALRPSLAAYDTLISSPDVSSRRAYQWMVRSTATAAIPYGMVIAFQQDPAMLCLSPLLGAAFGALAALLGLAIYSAIVNSLAKALGGGGEYKTLVFAMSAAQAPVQIAGLALGAVTQALPILAVPGLCAAFVLFLYQAGLTVFAVRAVHKLAWGRAVAAMAIPNGVFLGAWCLILMALTLAVIAQSPATL